MSRWPGKLMKSAMGRQFLRRGSVDWPANRSTLWITVSCVQFLGGLIDLGVSGVLLCSLTFAKLTSGLYTHLKERLDAEDYVY